MADKLRRIKPSANMSRLVKATGSAVIVKSGGWVTHRIHWEAPTGEPHKDANSEPLVNGRAYIAPHGKFTEFWISCETTPREIEDILLQVIEDASQVVVLNHRRNVVESQLLQSSDTHAILPAGGVSSYTLLYSDQVWAPTTSIEEQDRRMYWPARYLAGSACGDQHFVIKAYARVTSQNGGPKAPYALWNANSLDSNNPSTWGLEFGYGHVPSNTSFSTGGYPVARRLPFPIYGIELYVVPGSSTDLTTFTYSIFAVSED